MKRVVGLVPGSMTRRLTIKCACCARGRGNPRSPCGVYLMRQLLAKLWKDDCGALIASEFLFVATILVIGIVVGLANVRDAVNTELTEFGNALLALSQGYIISGETSCSASTDGSQAIDTPQLLVPPTHVAPAIPSVINVAPCS